MSITAAEARPGDDIDARILHALRTVWGFDSLRTLQKEAIAAGVAQRDSLLVMPTGGGKSLCYQVPPMIADRTDIVVSPLISLMKDQVDALRANGYPAAAIHSNLSPDERREIRAGIQNRDFRLIFISPERLVQPKYLNMVARMNVSSFAIDEAHCISHWGHDFRPEYRRLAILKEQFPHASVHAFTATATERVRDDIVRELRLNDARILVGRFDRPNLVYRVVPKTNPASQAIEILRRHPNEAAIIYCISRKDTEHLAAVLKANGFNADHYHAGMEKEDRTRIQDRFAAERLDIVVATVAFGMGIDRSNVRCVLHASMPKSIEHYQQETGRAGRDGLEAECVLLYSYSDVVRWRELIAKSAAEAESPDVVIEAANELLEHITRYAGGSECRHRALSRYFGQRYDDPDCRACDVCLGEIEGMTDSLEIAQKILSCIARTGERFGVSHIVQVLRGAATQQIRRWKHDEVSTHALLRDIPEKSLQNLVYQLVDQGIVDRAGGDRPYLVLNEDSWRVMRGERNVKLVEPETGPVHKTKVEADAWKDVDQGLFEALRDLRREIAQERGVPAFAIFHDTTLRELARIRPTSREVIANIRGIGQKKMADVGERFLSAIRTYSRENQVETDRPERASIVQPPKALSEVKKIAWRMFAKGAAIDEVCAETARAATTVRGYLCEFIEKEQPRDVRPWVDDDTYQRIAAAAAAVASDGRLKPIFEHLGEEVSYDEIAIVIAHQRALAECD